MIHIPVTTIDKMKMKQMWTVVVPRAPLVAQHRQSVLLIVIVMTCHVSEENARVSTGCEYSILLELLLQLSSLSP